MPTISRVSIDTDEARIGGRGYGYGLADRIVAGTAQSSSSMISFND
ncbi:hypothetical protein [Rubripirellula tenax]|nr:hypothetical protein [Rubripirellula tenax]